MFLTDLLLPRRLKFSTRLCSGYFMGFTTLAILYYFESLFEVNGIIAVAGPVLSLCCIFLWLKKGRPGILNAGEKVRPTAFILFVLIYVTSFFAFQFAYGAAIKGNTTQVYHDFLFHTGNIVALSRSFPAMDIRVYGLQFYYHYFMELLFGMCKHIFGMNAFELYMNGNAFVCTWPLVLALLTFGERLRANRQLSEARYFFYCFGATVSLICIRPAIIVGAKLPFSWMDNHYFTNANALGFGVCLTILVIDIVVEVWNDKFSWKNLIALILLMIAATGFKGTTGVLLAGITSSVFVIEWIVTKRFSIQKLLYSLGIDLAFILTYLIVVVGIKPANSNNHETELSPLGTLEFSRVGEVIERVFKGDYTSFPWIAIAIPLCGIVIFGPCLIPYIAWCIRKFKRLFTEGYIGDIYDWFAIGAPMIAIIAYLAITIEGLSQGYLMVAAAPLIFYTVIKYLEETGSKPMRRYMNVIWAIGIIFFLVDDVYYVYDGINQNQVYEGTQGDTDFLVSKESMEGYLWLRDNSDEDSLVAVDRRTENLDWRQIYFYCGAFGERQVYLEGFDYSDVSEEQTDAMEEINDMFFSENADVAEAALEMNGIDYIVVSKHCSPDYQCPSTRLQLVFENEAVTIYKFE